MKLFARAPTNKLPFFLRLVVFFLNCFEFSRLLTLPFLPTICLRFLLVIILLFLLLLCCSFFLSGFFLNVLCSFFSFRSYGSLSCVSCFVLVVFVVLCRSVSSFLLVLLFWFLVVSSSFLFFCLCVVLGGPGTPQRYEDHLKVFHFEGPFESTYLGLSSGGPQGTPRGPPKSLTK